jgi:uncharacterized protein (DUF427 family)
MPDTLPNPAPGFANHPEHTISLSLHPERLRVTFAGQTIAESEHALVMQEGSYPPVYYFPRSDVDMTWLRATDHQSNCPFKGDASYWTLCVGENEEQNAAWSYQTPFDEMREIKDYIAFYQSKVEIT